MNERELILTAVLECDRKDLYIDPRPLTDIEREKVRQAEERLRQGEPLQYILGRADFMGLRFDVDRRVLIPRPETEILVETVLARIRSAARDALTILDIGTGSGNIAVSLARFYNRCRVVALDISSHALDVARLNAGRHGVSDRIEFVHGSCRDFLNSCFLERRKFDIIITNPPYIPSDQMALLPADVRHEPASALDGGSDGCRVIQTIIARSSGALRPQGILAIEIGDGQKGAVETLLESSGVFQRWDFIKDYVGTDRIMIASC